MTSRPRAPREDETSRNRALESEYRFERAAEDRGMSVVAIVTLHQDELALEFVKTLNQGSLFEAPTERDVDVLLLSWEGKRFGRQLELAAHGILRGAVRRAIEAARDQKTKEVQAAVRLPYKEPGGDE